MKIELESKTEIIEKEIEEFDEGKIKAVENEETLHIK